MAVPGDEVHTETDEARGGSTPHIVRWVLGISILLGIVLLSAVWIFGAATQGDVEEQANVTRMVQDVEEEAQSRSDTDGVVIEGTDEIENAPERNAIDPADQRIPN